jgi:5-methylcytosine-specific restriction endonuclease McrA
MPKKRQPREIWQATRIRVLERDEYKCVRCQIVVVDKPDLPESANVDHIQSGKHGSNAMSNLRTLCARCHCLRADSRHRGMIARALKLGIIPPDWRELVWDDS